MIYDLILSSVRFGAPLLADKFPEQQASVAEFIGIAINAHPSNLLTKTGFETAAGIATLTPVEFAIVQAAHDQLRNG